MARKIGAGEENKMAESKVKEIEVKERKRKPNFSPLEISVITESVKKKHIDVIQSKLRNNITNKKKSSLGGGYQGGECCWPSESLRPRNKRQDFRISTRNFIDSPPNLYLLLSSSRSISRCWNFVSRICGAIRGNSKSAILFVLTKFSPRLAS